MITINYNFIITNFFNDNSHWAIVRVSLKYITYSNREVTK